MEVGLSEGDPPGDIFLKVKKVDAGTNLGLGGAKIKVTDALGGEVCTVTTNSGSGEITIVESKKRVIAIRFERT